MNEPHKGPIVAGTIQILKCRMPLGVMLQNCRTEEELQVEENYIPAMSLLPAREFPDVDDIAFWFDANKDELGWPAGWSSFDIVNTFGGSHDRTTYQAFLMMSPQVYAQSPWMQHKFKRAVHLGKSGLAKQYYDGEPGRRLDFYMLFMEARIPVISLR